MFCRIFVVKVYVYPPDDGLVSPTYSKILKALYDSDLLTKNPEQACLFIPSLDTLDRDPLSPQFGHRVAKQLISLPYWNRLPEMRADGQVLRNSDFSKFQLCLVCSLRSSYFPFVNI